MMSKEKRRVPKLRFPGFTEDWEQREFSDIFAEVKSGLSRMLSNDDIGLPVVRANNINDGQLNLVDDIKYWYKNDPQGANTNNYLIEQGDILINFINSEAKMGTAAYVTRRPERDTIYTTNILRCKVNDEYNPYFIYSLTFLNSYKNYIASITKPAVNQASFTTVDFKKYSIKIPTVKEQNQIADLIETFNKLITLHQRKLDNLKLKKKALLQKLFPKNGERYPELRFPGFIDAWEQRKLGDIATITGGGTPSTNISEYWNGDIDWYSPLEIGENRYVSRSTRKITKLGLEKSSAKILSVGTVLFTSRAGIGNTAILQAEGCTNQGFQSITPNSKELDTYFLYTMTPKLKRYGEVTGAGSTFVEVSGKQMEQMNLMIPSLEEQKHVSQLFELMDDAITLHQRKLDHLQLQKKALLQQMFV